MKTLVTGAAGMLGSDLVQELAKFCSVTGLSRHAPHLSSIEHLECDITNTPCLREIILDLRPDVIVHAAGYTDVDGCEQDAERAFSVNTDGTKSIADAALVSGAGLILLSSDYVFDGLKKEPYAEDDAPNPASVYGRSKRDAETYLRDRMRRAMIVRVEWLFGKSGRNFFKAILKKIAARETLCVVDDQTGAPTYTKDLASWIRRVLEQSNGLKEVSECDIYHLANSGSTTWHVAAEKLIEIMGLDIRVEKISSAQLTRPTKRPANSVFSLAKIKRHFAIEPRPWQEALRDYWRDSLKKEWEELQKISSSHR